MRFDEVGLYRFLTRVRQAFTAKPSPESRHDELTLVTGAMVAVGDGREVYV